MNTTYLYYTYSEVLENCCLSYFTKPSGKRTILITPLCTLPTEVAHATLHGMGLIHRTRKPFKFKNVKAVLFSSNCTDYKNKMMNLNKALPLR
uniref:Uncharacterized protein n=1 Tax=Bombyx mori TaxID=7091 RepID=A0A8R2M4S2_BOMMO|nr:uncharacterized protein LOC119630128 [Bombyx mori]